MNNLWFISLAKSFLNGCQLKSGPFNSLFPQPMTLTLTFGQGYIIKVVFIWKLMPHTMMMLKLVTQRQILSEKLLIKVAKRVHISSYYCTFQGHCDLVIDIHNRHTHSSVISFQNYNEFIVDLVFIGSTRFEIKPKMWKKSPFTTMLRSLWPWSLL